MRWRKLGRLYAANALHPKLHSHAANPLAVHLEGDVFRVFFSGRDQRSRSSVGHVDIDLARRQVVAYCSEPDFTFGPPGSYYADGVSIGCTYVAGGCRYMLFMGWHVPPAGHWYGQIGRLLMDDALALRTDGEAPLLSLDKSDPASLSYPWVASSEVGYQMWYGSTLTWDAGNGGMLHVIKQAQSHDGDAWERSGVAVPYQIGVAQVFSRPTVAARGDGSLDMWFSYRDDIGRGYRIGRATNTDGERWELHLAEAGIDVTPGAWDSEMIEYPFVFDHGGGRYMLYCGNGYGLTGFGLAVLEDDA
jgi:hypothetical protein